MLKRGTLFSLAAVLAAAVLPESQAQTAGPYPGYRIGPKDLLRIQVYEVPELNVDRRVAEGGTINLPLVGDVEVSGLTADETGRRLEELLARYLQRASANVEVLEFRSKPISVLGAVNQPGPLDFSGRWTLLEAITQAGGLAGGHGGKIYVIRTASNGLTDQVMIDADDLLVKADPKVNIPIFYNDLVNVPGAVDVTVYCLGEIATPGPVNFRSTERMTLLAAIARAGGLTDRAASRILIKRSAPGTDTGSRELAADYKRILAGKDPDLELAQGDVIVVKESFF
jgi:polysaccharide export outer membrane protein